MTWTTPKTWVTGDVLTASDMNTYVRDNTGDLNTRLGDTPILLGSDNAEYTTASTGTTTLKTFSGLTVSDNSMIMVELNYRKTSGGAYFATITVQTNGGGSATHMVAQVTDAVNLAGSGYLVCRIGPYYSNYVYSSLWSAAYQGSTAVQYAGAGTTQRATGVTSVVVTGQVSNAAITMGVQGIKVWEYPA